MISSNPQYNDLIDSYFDNTMSTGERESFLNELENNAELKKEFTFHLEIQQAISDPGYDNVSGVISEVLNPTKTKQKNSTPTIQFLQILKYAAVISVLFVFAFLMTKYLPVESTSNNLVNKYFEPYPAYNTFRGESNIKILIASAFSNYESKNYKEAISDFAELAANEPSNMAYVFYQANASLALDDFNSSAALFEKVVDSNNELLGGQAKWYLALSYLGANNMESAKSNLKDIVEDQNSNYNLQASELLKRLK